MEDTWQNFFQKRRKEILFSTVTGFALLILILFLGFVYEGQGVYIPEEYLNNAQQAIRLTSDVAEFSNEINQSYVQIAEKDAIGDYVSALSLIEENEPGREKIKNRLEKIVGILDEMTTSVKDIHPISVEKLGEDIILANIKIVERMLIYHAMNEELLDAIRAKLAGDENPNIQLKIQEINKEVQFINSISQEYQVLLNQMNQYVVEDEGS
ncbi:MAG: hypothetical protein COT89_02075 [Candidatus Colwellbacteria bacterium CG10_big_fil_rev_8_21_14_0_10_42_22]|uniref:Uncharacterized protein n=1 Tax=Candidatus Colwellbacteria bacterium CG10_big_fil_rev_8_21_14_0_10_42_22 TaxID=1974540 RepID=A0A2H0VFW8_9BACT|nr:MAG: hypothetical protein COT89_02075 [Candidatus Colwellbacteria bacterium CG10_big_fil_rev_8_21_14_0_10_42_22]